MLLRIACALLALTAAQSALACTIMVVDPPQVLVRHATVIVEAVATSEIELTVQAVRKGKAPATVVLKDAFGSSCYPGEQLVTGRRYVVLVDDLEPPANESVLRPLIAAAYSVDGKRGRALLRTLAGNPVVVSRADLIAMLRGWYYGTVPDRSFAEWVHRIAPIADFSDLEEQRPVLPVLFLLDGQLQRDDKPPLAKNPCVAVLRTQIAPLLIEGLGMRNPTEEQEPEFEQRLTAIEEEHPDCFS